MTKEWIVEGFRFQTEEDARAASKEAEGIRYIENKLNTNHPESVLQVYLKLIEDKVFSTPVGLNYLKDLQNQLIKSPFVMESEIIPIDIPTINLNRNENKEIVAEGIKFLKTKDPKTKKMKTAKTEKNENKGKLNRKEKNGKKIDGKKINGIHGSIIVNIILTLTVISMLILSMTSNTPTIINYKNKIINQYEHWENELLQREKALEIKENDLQLNKKDGN